MAGEWLPWVRTLGNNKPEQPYNFNLEHSLAPARASPRAGIS